MPKRDALYSEHLTSGTFNQERVKFPAPLGRLNRTSRNEYSYLPDCNPVAKKYFSRYWLQLSRGSEQLEYFALIGGGGRGGFEVSFFVPFYFDLRAGDSG